MQYKVIGVGNTLVNIDGVQKMLSKGLVIDIKNREDAERLIKQKIIKEIKIKPNTSKVDKYPTYTESKNEQKKSLDKKEIDKFDKKDSDKK